MTDKWRIVEANWPKAEKTRALNTLVSFLFICVCIKTWGCCACAHMTVCEFAHHTLLWPSQITRRKHTVGLLTSAVPKHTTVVCSHGGGMCADSLVWTSIHTTLRAHGKQRSYGEVPSELWKKVMKDSLMKNLVLRRSDALPFASSSHQRCFGPHTGSGNQRHVYSCCIQKVTNFIWRK